MRLIIRLFELDIENRPKDLTLARFHANLVSRAIDILGEWAASGRPVTMEEASMLAELLLRSKKALSLWRGMSFPKIVKLCQFIWRVATLIVKQRTEV